MTTPAILFEDEHLLLVDKPAGWLTVPTPKKEKKTLHDWLNAYVKKTGGKKTYLVHRIDRETSGLLCFAKSAGAQEKLEKLFRGHVPDRVYYALVQGVPQKKRGTLTHHLIADPKNPSREMVSRNPRFGVEAVTDYEILESFGAQAALLKVRPRTGRTNQIRVQLAHEGHPLVGDRKYSKASKYDLSAPRTLLHAASLAFVHPFTKKRLRADAPLPEDFEKMLARLRS